MTSRCSRFRRSAIEKNAFTCGRLPPASVTKRVSWSSVRSERVAGMSGTSEQVGRVHHVLRHQRNAWRAIQEDDVVVAGEAAQQLAEPSSPLAGVVELEVHVAVAEVSRKQVEALEVGRLQRRLDRPSAGDQGATSALDPRAHPEQERGRRLRIEVPQKCPPAFPRRQVGQVDRGGRLSDAPLEVVHREDLHRPAVNRRIRCRPDGRLNRANARSNSVAGPPLVGVQVGDELAHRQQGLGGRVCRPHLLGETVERLSLHVGVLEPAEHVLKILEIGDRALSGRVVADRREQLERVAQLLAPLPEGMQRLRR